MFIGASLGVGSATVKEKLSDGASAVRLACDDADEAVVAELARVMSEAPGDEVRTSVSVDADGESTGRIVICGSMRAVVEDVSKLAERCHGEVS
jgi:hypothetical protein